MFTKTLFFFFLAAFFVQQNNADVYEETVAKFVDIAKSALLKAEASIEELRKAIDDKTKAFIIIAEDTAKNVCHEIETKMDKVIADAHYTRDSAETCPKKCVGDIYVLVVSGPGIASDCVMIKLRRASEIINELKEIIAVIKDALAKYDENLEFECGKPSGTLCKISFAANAVATVIGQTKRIVFLITEGGYIVVYFVNCQTTIPACVTTAITEKGTEIFKDFATCEWKAWWG